MREFAQGPLDIKCQFNPAQESPRLELPCAFVNIPSDWAMPSVLACCLAPWNARVPETWHGAAVGGFTWFIVPRFHQNYH